MRKIQITIFVLLLMIGGIGLAFAIFSFNDPISKNLDLGIELEEYTDLGELWIEDLDYYEYGNPMPDATGLPVDNSYDMLKYHALFYLKHTYSPGEENFDPEGDEATAEILDPELSEYLTANIERRTQWFQLMDGHSRSAAFGVWLVWKEGKEVKDVESWRQLKEVLENAIANGTAKIRINITINPKA